MVKWRADFNTRTMLCAVQSMLSCSVHLSVCLSVTHRYCVQMAKPRTMGFIWWV